MTLELTEQEVNNILIALSKFPYCEVVELIEKISKQKIVPDVLPG